MRTSHHLVADVDFWPSNELLPLLRGALPAWGDAPRALVVPNFQRSGHGCRNAQSRDACRVAFDAGAVRMPANFSELLGCVAAKDCTVFDAEYNAAGQSSTDIDAWKRLAPGETIPVRCIKAQRYEPYVALATAGTPRFDERFRGYGKNKVQHAVELRLAGYAFDVLGGGYLLHFPHTKSASKERWLHKREEHSAVDHLFAAWEREAAAKYAGTKQRTPLCKRQAAPT